MTVISIVAENRDYRTFRGTTPGLQNARRTAKKAPAGIRELGRTYSPDANKFRRSFASEVERCRWVVRRAGRVALEGSIFEQRRPSSIHRDRLVPRDLSVHNLHHVRVR